MSRTYTEEEVDQLRKGWESDLFENKTEAALAEINHRLDQSNGYKETFGKSLTDIQLDLKDVKNKVLTLENERLKEAQAKEKARKSLTERVGHIWIRAGIAASIIWEANNAFGDPLQHFVKAHGLV